MLQDANYHVVALIDETGQVLQQFDYDPYGSVRALDALGDYADNRIGFQGLFADRYDTDAPHPEMAAGAFTTSYARNRDYRPDLGRWVQRDPNGSDLPLLSPNLTAGTTASTVLHPLRIGHTARDGMNLLVFSGLSPVGRVDPVGTFGLVSGLLTGFQMAESSLDAMQQAHDGVQMQMGVQSLLDSHSADQLIGLRWALDWSLPDDLLSGSTGQGRTRGGKYPSGPAMASLWRPWRGVDGSQIRFHPGGRYANGAHNLHMLARAELWFTRVGAKNVRFNLAFSDPKTGRTLDRRRPDLQIFEESTGTIHVIEIQNTSRRSAADIAAWRSMAHSLGYKFKYQASNIGSP